MKTITNGREASDNYPYQLALKLHPYSVFWKCKMYIQGDLLSLAASLVLMYFFDHPCHSSSPAVKSDKYRYLNIKLFMMQDQPRDTHIMTIMAIVLEPQFSISMTQDALEVKCQFWTAHVQQEADAIIDTMVLLLHAQVGK